MNLFKKHSRENEREAKKALKKSAKKIIGEYILQSKALNELLISGTTGESKSSKKNTRSLIRKIDKMTRKLSRFQDQMTEIGKTYKSMFGEDLDVKAITRERVHALYPTVCDGCGKSKSERPKGDTELPKEITDLADILKAKLEAGGKENVSVKVVRASDFLGDLGVNPDDYENFDDYYAAVKAKNKGRKAADITTEAKEPVLRVESDEPKEGEEPKGEDKEETKE